MITTVYTWTLVFEGLLMTAFLTLIRIVIEELHSRKNGPSLL